MSTNLDDAASGEEFETRLGCGDELLQLHRLLLQLLLDLKNKVKKMRGGKFS
jgi:hypothetical protein